MGKIITTSQLEKVRVQDNELDGAAEVTIEK